MDVVEKRCAGCANAERQCVGCWSYDMKVLYPNSEKAWND